MGKASKTVKTNALRIVAAEGIKHEVLTYPTDDGALDGVSVAAKIDMPMENVYKTLVTRGNGNQIYVFVIPVAETLDLKSAAQVVGAKRVEMVHVSEITPLTGYVKGGCSPIGMKKHYPTYIDASCLHLEKIVVSAGKIGIQLVIEPEALIRLVSANTTALTQRPLY
ncbi:Cys-tRNA(Pro) deacylase [Fusibacter paucivorans]|uniref:Cys-tRNA(Pro)/Cys-tRNA(Cys) deacylase n=1 Tax=Fusibacter paucivorans TaxID=76009 RepID=A0ABS5PKR3_9FIRM|nr:Cys-tRNA(Pro) deacylase [Fusibacter paucivorans]MBS7525477.1 Cys-tRNA(Pro) deacylase [Fusibacter paucivorans]